jgi:D-alanyl-lipoteichoic acid acyltransferase DltB (MBOAT superfamily)
MNVGMLAIFKFSDAWFRSFLGFLPALSIHIDGSFAATAIMPIGISFYTFCGLAYIVDVFQKKISPSRDFVENAVFIGFFPAIVSGPIERASHLLPQLQKIREFKYDKVVDGLKQILWGLFKKMVIADGCAEYVNLIFGNSTDYSGSTLVLGAISFSFQIYADFSGYSDIALGTARLLGIDLLQNFAFPYFSRDIAEFWRRWHMSLSSWFRDYVFYPLERRRIPWLKQGGSTVVVFLLTGIWHGASWTFIIWGGLNAIYLVWFLFLQKSRSSPGNVAQGRYLPSLTDIFNMGVTFGLTTFAWIFFRAEDINHAFNYIFEIVSWSIFSIPEILPVRMLILIAVLVIIEWLGREQKHALADFAVHLPVPLRWFLYYALMFIIFYYSGVQQEFIYSQF